METRVVEMGADPSRDMLLEQFPGAARFLAVAGPDGRELSHLYLHQADLEQAAKYVEALSAIGNETQPVVAGALWLAAIVSFTKCFGQSKARDELSADDVYGVGTPGREVFKYVKTFRDKHAVHDDNVFDQAMATAVLDQPGLPHKIRAIAKVRMRQDILNEKSCGQLGLLIKDARAHVEGRLTTLASKVLADLEAQPYAQLSALPDVAKLAPVSGLDVAVRRK